MENKAYRFIYDILEEVIPSKTVKEWVQSSNHVFKYGELISLIWNSDKNIKDKLALLNQINNENLLKEYFGSSYKDISSKLNEVISTVNQAVKLAYESNADTAIKLSYYFIDDLIEDESIIVVKNIPTLKQVLHDRDIECSLGDTQVELVDLNTGECLIEYILGSDNEPLEFISLDDRLSKHQELYSYIDIPMIFQTGDKVKIFGEEGIYVISNNNNPNTDNKTGLNIHDSYIEAIPEIELDKDTDYKEQLEKLTQDDLIGMHKLFRITHVERV